VAIDEVVRSEISSINSTNTNSTAKGAINEQATHVGFHSFANY